MLFRLHRRLVAGYALLAFLFAALFPALAVARQAVDPTAFATICRVDTGAAGATDVPGSLQGTIKSAHCVLCMGSGTPPSAITLAAVLVSKVPELLLPVDRRPMVFDDPAALQPLNPRAPPRS